MNRWPKVPRLPQSASGWFAELRGEDVTRAQSDAFTAWLSASPENEVSYEDHEVLWELSGEMQHRPRVQEWLKEADARLAARGAAARWRRWAAPLAAAIAFIAIGILTLVLMNRVVVEEYATAKGEQREVTLADGSTVMLNTTTHLLTRFSRSVREIQLQSGEALFSVVKDPKRPFEVHVLGGVTTAVGTQFVVRLRQDRAEVSVIEGVVHVATSGRPATDGVAVSAGEALDYSPSGDRSPVRPANAQRIDAWKAHRILFNDTPLEQAVAEYNDYASVPIILKSPELGQRRIHGVFRIGDEPSFVHALEQGLPLKAVQGDHQIELIGR